MRPGHAAVVLTSGEPNKRVERGVRAKAHVVQRPDGQRQPCQQKPDCCPNDDEKERPGRRPRLELQYAGKALRDRLVLASILRSKRPLEETAVGV